MGSPSYACVRMHASKAAVNNLLATDAPLPWFHMIPFASCFSPLSSSLLHLPPTCWWSRWHSCCYFFLLMMCFQATSSTYCPPPIHTWQCVYASLVGRWWWRHLKADIVVQVLLRVSLVHFYNILCSVFSHVRGWPVRRLLRSWPVMDPTPSLPLQPPQSGSNSANR